MQAVNVCYRSRDNKTAGPPRWPIIGNLVEIFNWNPRPHLAMQEMAKKYGEIAGFYIGNKPVILISGLVPIYELSRREDLAGRLTNPYKMFNKKGKLYGITNTSGEMWHEHREFAVNNLNAGLQKLDEIVHIEMKAVFEEMDNIKDERKTFMDTPVQDQLGLAILNVLLQLIFGKRYSLSASTLVKLMQHIKEMLKSSDVCGGMSVILPLEEKILFSPWKFTKIERYYNWFLYFFQEEYDQHKKSLEENNLRGYVDAYISEMMDQSSDQESTFTDQQLITTCFDLLISGTTTTLNVLEFALMYMVLHPEVQLKVQEEIDKVVGKDRLPKLEDRPKLPFTEATLLEIFRKSCVMPLSVPHACLKTDNDVKFREYVIPQNARVILNIYGLHHDTKVWIDPKSFRPERFLNDEGKIAGHHGLIPFGVGLRSCIGESIAHNTLLLLFAGLMQRYTVEVPIGAHYPSEVSAGFFLLSPKKFAVQMIPRN
ncbi:hypothetical protein J437_LFUL016118 [Ladona fulva]|uniref:Cytochrome P450 n=1 Tax=Ladona fulva TaxID=123851 RepID=A0A8K0KID0_LADFU|nr:hypothetical protein J437_LFUL016118 [Ladona fulva]